MMILRPRLAVACLGMVGLLSALSSAQSDGTQPASVLTDRHNTARELLVNISDSELETLYYNLPFDASDPALIKVLFRVPRFQLDNIQRLSQATKDISLQQLAADPQTHMAKIFRLTGRVQSVEREQLLAEVADDYDFDNYYKVTVMTDAAPNPIIVCARRIPKAWQTDDRGTGQVTRFYGLFLKLADDGESPPLVFATDHMGWYPDQLNEDLGIAKDHTYLSKLGMDFGLFEQVRTTNGSSRIPAHCFYNLFAAVAEADPGELADRAARFDLAPLLSAPQEQHGRLVTLKGNVRRVTRINVGKDFFARCYGVDHYYELVVFIPIDQPIHFRYGKGEDEKLVYENDYPVVVDVLTLPEGLEEGDGMNREIRVPCFFFKLWSYRSRFASNEDENARQRSPLLVGLEPTLVGGQSTAMSPYLIGAAIAGFAFVLGGIWFGLWRASRHDDEFKREKLDKQFEVPQGKSLDKMGIEAQDGPDFSGLE